MDFEAARAGLLAWYATADQAGARQFMAWAAPVLRALGRRRGLSGPALEDACQTVAGLAVDRRVLPLLHGQHARYYRKWLGWRLEDWAKAEGRHKDKPSEPTEHADPAGPRPLLDLDLARLGAALRQLTPARRAALLAYHWPSLLRWADAADRAGFAAASGRSPEAIEALLAQVVEADFNTSIGLLYSDARLAAARATCQNTYSTNRRLGRDQLRALLGEGAHG